MVKRGVHVVECGPSLHAYMRCRANLLSLREVAMKLPVWTRKFQLGLKGTGLVTAVFPDGASPDLLGMRDVDVDVGLEIVEPFSDDPIIQCGSTPVGRAATLTFPGPRNEAAAEMHQAIRDWCSAHGEKLAGPVWELLQYTQNPEWRYTRIFYMLAADPAA